MSLELFVAPAPGAEQLLAALQGGGDERYILLETLSATLLLIGEDGLDSIEVGVTGDDAPAAVRARDFDRLLSQLEQLGTVHDARDGRALVGPAREAAVRDFAGP